jgi:hypothetical protein
VRATYVDAIVGALHPVFIVATVMMAVAFALTWLLEERPLRQTVETASGVREALAVPQDVDSVTELTRELGRLVGRERVRRYLERTIAHAGLDLSPAEAWLLRRVEDGDEVAQLEALVVAREALLARGAVVATGGDGESPSSGLAITEDGQATLERWHEAHRECLRELVNDWPADDRPRFEPVISRLARELAAAEVA